MSIENAISDHAAAIRELAAAIRESQGGQLRLAAGLAVKGRILDDTELENAVTKVETNAKAAGKTKVTDAQIDAEIDEKAAKAAANKPKAEKEKAADSDDLVVLDYEKDIKGPLVKLLTKNKQAGLDLFAEFGVAKGTELKAAQLAPVLDRINELLAA